MTKQQILEKVIQKAIDGGWKYPNQFSGIPESYANWLLPDRYPQLIFNPDFAKALWGEEDEWTTTKCTCGGRIHPLMDMHDPECKRVKANRGYKFHLQQMVIAEDPIKYLGDNLDG